MTFAQCGLEGPGRQPCIQRCWQCRRFDVTIDEHPVRIPRTRRAREHSDVQVQELLSVPPGAKDRRIPSGKDSLRNGPPVRLLKQGIGTDRENPCCANRPTSSDSSKADLDLLECRLRTLSWEHQSCLVRARKRPENEHPRLDSRMVRPLAAETGQRHWIDGPL